MDVPQTQRLLCSAVTIIQPEADTGNIKKKSGKVKKAVKDAKKEKLSKKKAKREAAKLKNGGIKD